jgi:hypothetical protein
VPVIKNKKKLILGALLLIIVIAVIVIILHKVLKTEVVLKVEKDALELNDRLSAKPDYNDEFEGHFLIAQNDNYKMYFEEAGLSIILMDKKTGKVLRSAQTVKGDDKNLKAWEDFMASGLSIEMLRTGTRQTVRYTMYSENVNKSITYYQDGFSAAIDMTIAGVKKDEQQVKLQMDVFLTEKGIDVCVPSSSIQDTVGDQIDKLSSVFVYPFLGSTNLDEKEGYMFIPDGSGVIVSLEDHHGRFTTPYSAKVYGKDKGIDAVSSGYDEGYPDTVEAEPIYIPLYGMVYTEDQTGFMGLIKSGQESANIVAYPNGVSTSYNWISSQFFLRDSYIHQTSKNGSEGIAAYEKNLKGSDIYVSYYYMPENASYNQMAKIYRDYLIEKGVLVRQESTYKIGIDVIGAENRDGIVSDRTFTMTTFDDTANMLDYLKENGVDGINLIYRGWQKGGYDGGFPISDVKIEKKVGGSRGLKELIEKAHNMSNVEISLYDDFGVASKSKIYDTGKDIVKRIDKLIYDDGDYFLTPIKLLELSSDTIPQYKELKLNSLAISGITNNLYTYLTNDKVSSREHTRLEQMEVLRDVSEDLGLYMDAPYDYLWQYAKGIYNLPLSGSNYSYTTAEIPFLSIVLKGYVPMYSEYCNLNAAPTDYELKLAESGVFPNYIITEEDNTLLMNTSLEFIFTSRFDDFKENMIASYHNLKLLNEKVSNAVIVEHQILENDFVRVTYDNGVRVYVNYSAKAKKADNIEIAGKSYQVVAD